MTKQETPECSLVTAFAELGRLERDRAEFAAAKRDANDALSRQGIELALLRERLETERPRAIARVRRQRARRQRIREQTLARLSAEAETAHVQRLDLFRAELEAKRLRLAALEVANTEAPPPTSRRLLEWSMPVAATALVAFLGFTLFDEDQAVAGKVAAADTIERIEASGEQAPVEPAATPQPEPEVVEPEVVEPEPEVVEVEPEPAPTKTASSTKKKSTKKQPTKTKKAAPTKKAEPKPVIKKHSNPLELGDFNGNPLG